MFSELEEKRASLEEQLGCEVFLKAYKAVQVRVMAHDICRSTTPVPTTNINYLATTMSLCSVQCLI